MIKIFRMLLITSVIFHPAWASDKGKVIWTDIDLSRYVSPVEGYKEKETIELEVYLERLVPKTSEYIDANSPELGEHQFGFMRYLQVPRATDAFLPYYVSYTIEYKGRDLQKLAFEIIRTALVNSGYHVRSSSEIEVRSEAVKILAVVRTFWVWRESTEAKGKYRFYYQMVVDFSQSEPPFSGMGEINTIGYLNGSRPTAARSWRNTSARLIKTFIIDLEESVSVVENNRVTDNVAEYGADDLEILTQELKKLAELKNNDLLSDEEYEELRREAIDSYKN